MATTFNNGMIDLSGYWGKKAFDVYNDSEKGYITKIIYIVKKKNNSTTYQVNLFNDWIINKEPIKFVDYDNFEWYRTSSPKFYDVMNYNFLTKYYMVKSYRIVNDNIGSLKVEFDVQLCGDVACEPAVDLSLFDNIFTGAYISSSKIINGVVDYWYFSKMFTINELADTDYNPYQEEGREYRIDTLNAYLNKNLNIFSKTSHIREMLLTNNSFYLISQGIPANYLKIPINRMSDDLTYEDESNYNPFGNKILQGDLYDEYLLNRLLKSNPAEYDPDDLMLYYKIKINKSIFNKTLSQLTNTIQKRIWNNKHYVILHSDDTYSKLIYVLKFNEGFDNSLVLDKNIFIAIDSKDTTDNLFLQIENEIVIAKTDEVIENIITKPLYVDTDDYIVYNLYSNTLEKKVYGEQETLIKQ